MIPSGCDSFDIIRASTDIDGLAFLNSLEPTQLLSSLSEVSSIGGVAPKPIDKFQEAIAALENEEKEWFKFLKKNATQSKSESDYGVDNAKGATMSKGDGHDVLVSEVGFASFLSLICYCCDESRI